MRNFTKRAVFLAILILLIISNITFATTERLEEFININADPNIAEDAHILTNLPVDSENVSIINDKVTINDDIYIEGENVIIEEDIDGSVHITATNVNIESNEITGNIFIVANKININSLIKGSAFLIAETIDFNGEVFDLYTISNNLNINSNSKCNSIKTISENLNIKGIVERDLYAISSNLNLEQNSNALINGNIYCIGEVLGDKTKAENIESYVPDFEIKEEIINAITKGFKTAFFMLKVSTGFFIIIALVVIMPRKRINNVDISQKFFKYTLNGIGYYVLAILICILLMITIIGIPFALLMLVVVALLFSKIALPLATIEIAKLIVKNQEVKSKILIAILAFLVFLLVEYLHLIPVIGYLISLILSLYGFGIIVNAIFKNKIDTPDEVISTNL